MHNFVTFSYSTINFVAVKEFERKKERKKSSALLVNKGKKETIYKRTNCRYVGMYAGVVGYDLTVISFLI